LGRIKKGCLTDTEFNGATQKIQTDWLEQYKGTGFGLKVFPINGNGSFAKTLDGYSVGKDYRIQMV
jgi:hypothetical protein